MSKINLKHKGISGESICFAKQHFRLLITKPRIKIKSILTNLERAVPCFFFGGGGGVGGPGLFYIMLVAAVSLVNKKKKQGFKTSVHFLRPRDK